MLSQFSFVSGVHLFSERSSLNVQRWLKSVLIVNLVLGLSACTSMGGSVSKSDNIQAKRQKVLNMRDDSLKDFYQLKPHLRSRVQQAPGYAVFSDANINLILASFSGGYGVVTDNQTGKNTYMNMGEVGIGLGLGLKDFRSLFIFNDRATMDRFINDGFEFGAHADAAAVNGTEGASVGGELLVNNISIYQITKRGLALQATIKGTKYWRSPTLN
ncbi:MAG: lipid-binding SYLF domain-containing protein [bacterium]